MSKKFTDKFLGNRMEVKDIDGCKPKDLTSKYLNESMYLGDIDGT